MLLVEWAIVLDLDIFMSLPPDFPQARAVASLATLYVFRMLGLFMVLPVISLSGADYSGSSIFLLGIALGVYGLTQALLQIPFGVLSDRFGRKPLILLGLILFALGSWVAATADSVVGLIAGRALQGAGAVAGVIMAMVGDVTLPEHRSKAMAAIGASIGLAFALALVLGPVISSFQVNDVTGIRLLFWIGVALSVIGMAVLLWLIPDVSAVQQKVSSLSRQHLSSVVSDRQYQLLYFGVFVLHFVLMGLFVVVPLLLEQAQIARQQHSWVYLGTLLLSFVVIVPLMIFCEKKHKVKMGITLAVVLLILSLLVIKLFSTSWILLILGLFIFFVGFNFMEANLPSLLTRVVPSQFKGAGSGVFATCQFAGAALGGVVIGGLYSTWGLHTSMVVLLLLLLVWLVVSNAMVIPQRDNLQRKPA